MMGVSVKVQSLTAFGLDLSAKRCARDDSLGSKVTSDDDRDAKVDKKPADGKDEAISVSLISRKVYRKAGRCLEKACGT